MCPLRMHYKGNLQTHVLAWFWQREISNFAVVGQREIYMVLLMFYYVHENTGMAWLMSEMIQNTK